MGKIGRGESPYKPVYPNGRCESEAGGCSGIGLWQAEGHSYGAYQYGTKSTLIHCLNYCVQVARSNFPPGSQPRKPALLRPISLPEDKTFSRRCESIFFVIWGRNMSLSCTDSVVPGRAKLRSNL